MTAHKTFYEEIEELDRFNNCEMYWNKVNNPYSNTENLKGLNKYIDEELKINEKLKKHNYIYDKLTRRYWKAI